MNFLFLSALFLISPYNMEPYLIVLKKLMFAQYLKVVIRQFLLITDQFHNLDKALERLVFKYLYNHLLENNILTSFQSGFRPGDSTVNQLTYLYDTFCHELDSEKEIRVVFCDISKAFDRVWHSGLIHKL